MLKIINLVRKRLSALAVLIGRHRLRAELLKRTDRVLADAGFSRDLLDQGVDAWPWRAGAQLHSSPAKASFAKAVAELRNYSDEELADLAISRAGIVDAVRNGRPGIERQKSESEAGLADAG